MELWLLGAGAIVLVAITLWIVWPARAADAVGATVPIEEERSMNEYTSATADPSAGGVATAADALHAEPAGRTTPDTSSHRWSPPSAGDQYSSPLGTSNETRALTQPRKLGLGAGALLSIGGAVGGAWLYARWQRERNKPINRLRRGAHDVASRLGERMPDVEDIPRGAAPMSGAATALLITGLLASRALRREPTDRTEEMRDQASDLLERGRAETRKLSARLPIDRLPSNVEPPRRGVLGLGFGGLAILAGGTYVVWRMVRGGNSNRSWDDRSAD